MKPYLFAFISCIFFTLSIQAQLLTPKQKQAVRNLIATHYPGNEVYFPYNQGENSFVTIGNDTFYNPPGYHYLFKIKGDTLLRLDHSVYHGGNFERFMYAYNGKIYLMGGYGFFNTNNNIEVFDPAAKEWELIKTTGEKPNFIFGICLKVNNEIYSLYNTRSGNMVEEEAFDPYIYKFDLRTSSWTRISNMNSSIIGARLSMYFTDYCVSFSSNQALLINKKRLQYIIIPKNKIRVFTEFDLFDINNNSIRFVTKGSTKQASEHLVNLDSLWNEFSANSKPLILEPSITDYIVYYKNTLAISVGLFFIGLFMIIGFKKRRKKHHSLRDKKTLVAEKHPLYFTIINHTNTRLNIDELDDLLQISHMETESRKLKRHRLLNDVEHAHPGLIQRQKDETDKRRFIYTIQKGD